MDQELEQLKKDMDCWVKQINKQLNSMKIEGSMIKEMGNNIQHNYELIMEQRALLQDMQVQINKVMEIGINLLQKLNAR